MSAWSEDWTEAEAKIHTDAVAAVLAACRRHGVAPGIHTGDGGTAHRYLEQGFLMVTVANELGLITNGGRAELARARGSAA
jgi:4-hydroxy-2-oxoheptanedioate aldolase